MLKLEPSSQPATLQNFTFPTPARKRRPIPCAHGQYRLTSRKELRMVEQSNAQSKAETPSEDHRRGRRGTFVIPLVAVALLAGLTGNLLAKAFGQGGGWHHIAWHDSGMFRGPPPPAPNGDLHAPQTKHKAVQVPATADHPRQNPT